ncbi:meiosis regulator and mRNA stability factor 1 [Anopheles maculipalpis]|uniref:meiosis regulator and mRNA stability factor 1 n=1 Tax=Anopheles maculipalpis TaxID=1496333 RepID=UPI0021593FBC|nr:meiosis regulator and mRNA stability factor 1 [Anopheles maculipalpis]
MHKSNANTYYDRQSFPDLVANLAVENTKMYNMRHSYSNGQGGGYNMKYYNYYQQSTPYVPQMYGNCFPKQRYAPYPNHQFGGNINMGPSNYTVGTNHSNLPQPLLAPHSQQQSQHPSLPFQSASTSASSSNTSSSVCQLPVNKSLNSSLNSSSYSDSGKNSTFFSSNQSGCSSPHQSNYSTDSGSMASSTSNSSLGTCSGSSGLSVSPIAAQDQAGPPPPPTPSVQPLLPSIVLPGGGGPGSGIEPPDQKEMVVLQISNLDSTIEEHKMHQFLMCQLKPITPVISLTIESPSLAKVKVPTAQCAKQVVANLHRKKIGHKRMVVSYIKDPSSAECSALRCQVAGLLKDVPFCSLPINRFRELFQSRFKSSISVLDLYRMPDVCTITLDKNEEKHISLQPAMIDSLKSSSLVETSHHSVPYCMQHFKQEKDKGWAEQEIEPLPNVMMSINQLQAIVYSLLKSHKNDIPVASILYCIEHEMRVKILPDDNGVPLEHLLCCIRGVQIANNRYGIKVLSWMEHEQNSTKDNDDAWSVNLRYMPKSPCNEFLQQISREVVELIKMSPKSTMKFTRFIPAYHNHFGKQCRVADYGYTRLIELFEALSPVVQVMGDGENRHITLTHRTQIRRFTNDLLKILRNRTNKSILLSQLSMVFAHVQNRPFDVTDYGVCNIFDMVDGLMYSNAITTKLLSDSDVMISIVKRKQTLTELDKTSVFAGEVVELFRKAPQFSILFKKFVRSYHYHFGYQCRLSDYGLLKLADLLEAITGIVEMEQTNDEDRKIYLNYQVALRIFAEQVQEIIKAYTGKLCSVVRLSTILHIHKNQYGYQLQPSCLGFSNMYDAIKALPYTEVFESGGEYMVISHLEDPAFRMHTYAVCMVLMEFRKAHVSLSELMRSYHLRFNEFLNEKNICSMKHALTIEMDKGLHSVTLTALMKFVMRMVQVVKQRTSISVYDLKLAMNVSLGTCFEFGYPNLVTVLNAFSDVFVAVGNCSVISDKSDIELNRDCILSKAWYGSQDSSSLKGPTSQVNLGQTGNLAANDSSRFQCAPAPAGGGGCYSKDVSAPFRNTSNPQYHRQSLGSEHATPLFKCLQQPQGPQPLQATSQASSNTYFPNNRVQNVLMPNNYGPRNNGSNASTLFPPMAQGPSIEPQKSDGFGVPVDKENIRPAQNRFVGVQDLMSSTNYGNQFRSNFPQDQLSSDVFQFGCQPKSVMGSKGLLEHSTGQLLLSNRPSQQQKSVVGWRNDGNIKESFDYWNTVKDVVSACWEPPKPDTPTELNLPFWLDPIWSDSLQGLDRNTLFSDSPEILNIPIPELKTINNLPPLNTPLEMLSEQLSKFPFDLDK